MSLHPFLTFFFLKKTTKNWQDARYQMWIKDKAIALPLFMTKVNNKQKKYIIIISYTYKTSVII